MDHRIVLFFEKKKTFWVGLSNQDQYYYQIGKSLRDLSDLKLKNWCCTVQNDIKTKNLHNLKMLLKKAIVLRVFQRDIDVSLFIYRLKPYYYLSLLLNKEIREYLYFFTGGYHLWACFITSRSSGSVWLKNAYIYFEVYCGWPGSFYDFLGFKNSVLYQISERSREDISQQYIYLWGYYLLFQNMDNDSPLGPRTFTTKSFDPRICLQHD